MWASCHHQGRCHKAPYLPEMTSIHWPLLSSLISAWLALIAQAAAPTELRKFWRELSALTSDRNTLRTDIGNTARLLPPRHNTFYNFVQGNGDIKSKDSEVISGRYHPFWHHSRLWKQDHTNILHCKILDRRFFYIFLRLSFNYCEQTVS